MSNEQFDLTFEGDSDDEDDDDFESFVFAIALPFSQSRIVSPTPEPLSPFFKSDDVGRKVKVFGGTFHNLNPDTSCSEVELEDFVGEILATQHGRIVIYDAQSEVFVGWLSPDEYEFTVPFNTEINVSWTQ